MRSATERGLDLPTVTGVQAMPGKGVQGEIDGKRVYVGNRALMEEIGISVPDDPRLAALEEEGKTLVFAASNKIMGAIALADLIRGESRAAVAELKSAGIQVAMLTSDSKPVAEWVGRELGLDMVFPEVKPGEKALKVKQLQEAGSTTPRHWYKRTLEWLSGRGQTWPLNRRT